MPDGIFGTHISKKVWTKCGLAEFFILFFVH